MLNGSANSGISKLKKKAFNILPLNMIFVESFL